MKQLLLKLFITGRTGRSMGAVRNIRSLYDRYLSSEYDLVVIDVLEHPEQAEEEKILATPTLVRITPQGSSRIIGDLSNSQEVLKLLDAPHGPHQRREEENE
jgi:circadian clock protein KaiB